MNTEQWIKDTSYGLKVGLSSFDGCQDEVKFTDGCEVVKVTDLNRLLATHIIVPREPSVKMLTRGNAQQEWAQNIRLTYKAMIESSEEEL